MDAHLKAETNLAHGVVRSFDRTVADLRNNMKAVTGSQSPGAGNAHATQGMEKLMRTAEEMMSIGQGNLDATIQFGQTLANGLQDLSRQTMTAMQTRAEEANAMIRAVAGAKSVREVVELQSNLGRANMEKAVSEFTKLTEASFNLMQQAFAPITQQITRASEKFSVPA